MRGLILVAMLLAVWFVTPQPNPASGFQQVAASHLEGGAISGTIIGPESRAVAGVTVFALRQQPDPASQIRTFTSRSDDKGHFAFRLLPPGIYQVEVSPADKWLFKQTAPTVHVRESGTTTVEIRLQFIDQCTGTQSQELTSSDRAAIIKLMLEEAVTRKRIPSYPQVVSGNRIILSTRNVELNETPGLQGYELLLLSPAEIQARANRNGDLMYLEFEKIEVRGSCVAISLCNLWADGTSSIETAPKVLLGEGGLQFVFKKQAGTWRGEFITGWIS